MTDDRQSEKTSEPFKQGDYVKIVRHGERFWVQVIGSSDEHYFVGRVNNHLEVAPYSFGDEIPFDDAEVIKVIKGTGGEG